ncbi:hypothetical protein [Metaclostridioides mangenotii]|uniref:hypothetical protein n=1 Tax=Metaclostridioides mangenotii TaxID=1540 RepID=UPI00048A2F37|nr:hypothetical protein [Clostridioides mangenotii]
MNIENSKDLLISEDDLNNLELKIPWYYSLGIITFLFLLYPFTFFISGVLALICLFGRKKIIKKHNEKIKLYSDRILEFNKHYSELAEEVYKKELSLKNLNVEYLNMTLRTLKNI